MSENYISVRSNEGINYEGAGSIYDEDWRMKVNGGILNQPWYSVVEIRIESEDKVMISQFTAFKKDFYRIGDRPLISGTCSLNFFEDIVKNIRENR